MASLVGLNNPGSNRNPGLKLFRVAKEVCMFQHHFFTMRCVLVEGKDPRRPAPSHSCRRLQELKSVRGLPVVHLPILAFLSGCAPLAFVFLD